MIRNHIRLAALASCSLPLVLGCASSADEPVGELSAAAVTGGIYMRIAGIDGEVTDPSPAGSLFTWEASADGTGSAQVVTECDGPACRVVSADVSLQSSANTIDGHTSVWQLAAN